MALRSTIKILSNRPHNMMMWNPSLVAPRRHFAERPPKDDICSVKPKEVPPPRRPSTPACRAPPSPPPPRARRPRCAPPRPRGAPPCPAPQPACPVRCDNRDVLCPRPESRACAPCVARGCEERQNDKRPRAQGCSQRDREPKTDALEGAEGAGAATDVGVDRAHRRHADDAADRKRQYDQEISIEDCLKTLTDGCSKDRVKECQEYLEDKCIDEKCPTEACRSFLEQFDQPKHQKKPKQRSATPNTQSGLEDDSEKCKHQYKSYSDHCDYAKYSQTNPKQDCKKPESKGSGKKGCNKPTCINKCENANRESKKGTCNKGIAKEESTKPSKEEEGKKCCVEKNSGTKQSNFWSNKEESKKKEPKSDTKEQATCQRGKCTGDEENTAVPPWCSKMPGPQQTPDKCVEKDVRYEEKWRNIRAFVPRKNPINPMEDERLLNPPKGCSARARKSDKKPDKKSYHTSAINDMRLFGNDIKIIVKKPTPKPKTYIEIVKQAEDDIKKFKRALNEMEKLKNTGLGKMLKEDMRPQLTDVNQNATLVGSLKVQMPTEDKQIRVETSIENDVLNVSTYACDKGQQSHDENQSGNIQCLKEVASKEANTNLFRKCNSSNFNNEKKSPSCTVAEESRLRDCRGCKKCKDQLGKFADSLKNPCSKVSQTKPSFTQSSCQKIEPLKNILNTGDNIPKSNWKPNLEKSAPNCKPKEYKTILDTRKDTPKLNGKISDIPLCNFGAAVPPKSGCSSSNSKVDAEKSTCESSNQKDTRKKYKKPCYEPKKNSFFSDDCNCPPKGGKFPKCNLSSVLDNQQLNKKSAIEPDKKPFQVPKELSSLLPNDWQSVLKDFDKLETYIDTTEKNLKQAENENLRKANMGAFGVLKDYLWLKINPEKTASDTV